MRTNENIQEMLDYLQTTEEKTLEFDNKAIVAAYQKNSDAQSLLIKIVSVFGGILASIAFVVFLFIAGLENSTAGLFAVGTFCLVGAIWINKKYEKIILDTLSISFFIIGFILIGFGFGELDVDYNIICGIFIIIAFASLVIVQNYVPSFVSVLIISGSVLTLIMLNKGYELIHVYVSGLALIMTFWFLKEAKIITASKILSKLYNPIRIGLTFSFIAGLAFLGVKWLHRVSPDCIWVSSIIIISVIVYLVCDLFTILNIKKIQHKIAICTFTVLVLAPTVFSPAISGAMLIILLSFRVNYKTGLILGVAAFIYFISQYYYDLNFTLLTKSVLLFSSGILFIALYLFIHKKLTTNDKI